MPIGRVKWFNNSKGYGFILADGLADGLADPVASALVDVHAESRANSLAEVPAASPSNAPGEDLFVHYSSIQMEGYRTLRAGELVQFDTQPADRGLHAINVRRLAEPSVAIAAPSIARAELQDEAAVASATSVEVIDTTR